MDKETLRTIALSALHKAKALKDEHGITMSADVKTQFDAHMAEYVEYGEKYKAAKATEEQFSALDAGIEEFAAPATQNVQSTISDLANEDAQQANSNEKVSRARQIHKEAFRRYVSMGEGGLTPTQHRAFMGGGFTREELAAAGAPEEAWAHLGSVDHLGGFLVPDDFMSELIRDLAGFTVMRNMARVRMTSSDAAVFMTVAGSGNRQYSSGVTGSFRNQGWVQGGNNIPTQNQPRFGRERVPVYTWSPDVIELTMELLEDSAVNLDAEVRALLAETRGMDEDSAFLLGTGVGMPMGIVTEADAGNIVTVGSGAATAQTYTGLVNLWAELPAQYRMRAKWLMNSVTLAAIALLEDTVGNPIFPTNEIPTMLFGKEIMVSEFMPDGSGAGTTGNHAIIYGDFANYGIADRMDMRIVRLSERFAPNIGLLAVARVGGQMLRAEPFRAQVID